MKPKIPAKWKIKKHKFNETEMYFQKEDQAWFETAESETLILDIIKDTNQIIDVLHNLEARLNGFNQAIQETTKALLKDLQS